MAITLAEIETLTQSYQSKDIKPSPKPGLPPANQEFNDKISLFAGDITKLELDTIVNAANSNLAYGKGVAQAVFDAAGKDSLEKYFSALGGKPECKAGEAVISPAYALPCRMIIHAVGPIYDSSNKYYDKTIPREQLPVLLRKCYTNSLDLAVNSKCRSIAFCALSVGAYGYPLTEATSIALDKVKKYLLGPNGHKIDRIVFCIIDGSMSKAEGKDILTEYKELIPEVFPPVAAK